MIYFNCGFAHINQSLFCQMYFIIICKSLTPVFPLYGIWYRVGRYWNTLLQLLPTKTLQLLQILEYLKWCLVRIINICIMSKCYIITTLKLGLLIWTVDSYFLSVLNPIVLHCNMLRYSAIYCIYDIIDMQKCLLYQLLHTSILWHCQYIEILPNTNMVLSIMWGNLWFSLKPQNFTHQKLHFIIYGVLKSIQQRDY